jgi:pantetheine-phosphate adenylyltransferase
MKVKAIYAGTFDPITNGHMDIIKRSMKFCGELVVLVGVNSAKKTFFSEEERIDLINHTLNCHDTGYHWDNGSITVSSYNGLIIDYAKQEDVSIMIRGIRSVSDFEYEINLANVNKVLAPHIETIFLPTRPELAVVSSSMVKEIAKYQGDITPFVSVSVAKAIHEKLNAGSK